MAIISSAYNKITVKYLREYYISGNKYILEYIILECFSDTIHAQYEVPT